MNEQKQARHKYFNPETKNQEIDELLVIIKLFVASTQLKLNDLIVLDKIIKQINASKGRLSNKVIRAMESKFKSIRNQYQK